MLQCFNIFWFVFHTAFLLFNLFGWIWKPTRRWHLYSVGLTYASWFILGIWYGWGYCACTDWHWSVRREMGIVDVSDSYTHFLIHKITGINLPFVAVDYMTLGGLLAATVISVWLNVRDWRRRALTHP
jgi:hypothetical protein